jgi:hypothetical protein
MKINVYRFDIVFEIFIFIWWRGSTMGFGGNKTIIWKMKRSLQLSYFAAFVAITSAGKLH